MRNILAEFLEKIRQVLYQGLSKLDVDGYVIAISYAENLMGEYDNRYPERHCYH